VSVWQNLPPRLRWSLFFWPQLALFLIVYSTSLRADILEDTAKALARKVLAVPQRDNRFFLSWKNNSSLTEEHSQMLKEFFASGIGTENLADKQEADMHTLQFSI